jgi:hypothetical protein
MKKGILDDEPHDFTCDSPYNNSLIDGTAQNWTEKDPIIVASSRHPQDFVGMLISSVTYARTTKTQLMTAFLLHL